MYLYPFLNTTYRTRQYEYLRLTSLGVIGALVKVKTLRQLGIAMNFYLDFRVGGGGDGGQVINLDFLIHIPVLLIK